MTPTARAEIHGLLTRLAEGDRTAIAPSFDALWPIVYGFSARALGNEADAQDAAQEAIVKLFAQVSELDTSRDGVAWALTIVAYECRTVRRKRMRKREASTEGLEVVATLDSSPEDVAVARDLEAAARDVLRELPESDQTTILAALEETRPRADAAFRKRLQRAFARLRLAWRAKHEPE